VFFILILSYFFLSCFIAWVLFFHSGRQLVFAVLSSFGKRVERNFLRLEQGTARKRTSISEWLQECILRCTESLRSYWSLLFVLICLLVLPSLIAMLASRKTGLDGFDPAAREVNVQIAELLKGEQLAAPLPLPPAVFSTSEVLLVRPMLVSASRNWDLLDNNYKQRLLMVFRIMKEKYGYDMVLLEGYRSPDRQDMLALLGPQVSNAKAFQSYHQFGLAADCAFIRDGKLVISERDTWAMRGYELYGEVAQAAGLVWGGGWKMRDFGHTELRQSRVLTSL
jgi:peptidoglycan L-alanyl-D-glutamate endopeptidase CwlK